MPEVVVFYQYLYPDDVISAVHFSDLCTGLAARGWKVKAFPCNRGCRDDSRRYRSIDEWRKVTICRIWRPKLKQSSNVGRLFNALWMIAGWSLLAIHPKIKPDVLIVGTDPILSIIVAPIWRCLKPKTQIVHWCFDLYPEAAFADGVLHHDSFVAKLLRALLRPSYAACHLIVDIGSCMRERLALYGSRAERLTLVPWAIEEPTSALPIAEKQRQTIFAGARLALMYSGNFGRAHSCEDVLRLMRLLRSDNIQMVFSVRGNREMELHKMVTERDINIHFVPFVPQEYLRDQLGCADVHVVSLRDEWTGTVVPSKFFGALAVGRPVLFCGNSQSAVARWIEQFKLGWVLSCDTLEAVARSLRAFSAMSLEQKEQVFRHCHQVYNEQFSREITLNQWDMSLSELIK